MTALCTSAYPHTIGHTVRRTHTIVTCVRGLRRVRTYFHHQITRVMLRRSTLVSIKRARFRKRSGCTAPFSRAKLRLIPDCYCPTRASLGQNTTIGSRAFSVIQGCVQALKGGKIMADQLGADALPTPQRGVKGGEGYDDYEKEEEPESILYSNLRLSNSIAPKTPCRSMLEQRGGRRPNPLTKSYSALDTPSSVTRPLREEFSVSNCSNDEQKVSL